MRRVEFFELPKMISPKIRRVELRGREEALAAAGEKPSPSGVTTSSPRSRVETAYTSTLPDAAQRDQPANPARRTAPLPVLPVGCQWMRCARRGTLGGRPGNLR
jgi:hypothetical protein